MTVALRKGRFGVRLAETSNDLAACQALRHQCFFGQSGRDADDYDARCQHVMIADSLGLVSTCRVLILPDGTALGQSYAGQRYDLHGLSKFDAPLLELGRFCIAPRIKDGDVLRLVWGALAQIVDREQVGMIFGCTSFSGVDPEAYAAAFAWIAARSPAPDRWAPGIASPEVVRLHGAERPEGARDVPPLLRSYLSMGGWVSDHAVVDREMQTLHVFTGLEVAAIPPRRAAALRAVVG